jgi:hypothetical protein
MQYMLLIYGEESLWEGRSEEAVDELMAGYGRFSGELRDQGKLVAGEELARAATATTVQVRNGDTIVSDGPFAATKEVLGGYFIVEAESLDEAIEWAAKIPDARDGKIEIRPIVDHSGDGA